MVSKTRFDLMMLKGLELEILDTFFQGPKKFPNPNQTLTMEVTVRRLILGMVKCKKSTLTSVVRLVFYLPQHSMRSVQKSL